MNGVIGAMGRQIGNLGALAGAAFDALGRRVDPYLAVNFVVEIHGLLVAGFSKVEGLQSSIETQDYVEGGRNDYVHKLVKGATYPPLVLSHGLTDNDELWSWHERVRSGLVERKNGTILLLDSQRIPVMWWNFSGALPVKWAGPSFDASADGQVAIERLELVHRGIGKPLASRVISLARRAASQL